MKFIYNLIIFTLVCAEALAMNSPGIHAIEKFEQKTNQEIPPQDVATAVITSGAFPGPEFTATLKRRNPPALKPQAPLDKQKESAKNK